MKKYLFLIAFLIINFMMINKVYADDNSYEILMKYSDPTQPVTYYNTDTPVKLPLNIVHKKQEMRAVYVSTINNLDFKQSDTIGAFQSQFENILSNMKFYNMNTVIFEVRPLNDAFYPSKFNTWSRFLTGTEGKDPGWDPLAWMVTEAHKNGISFNAAFNAFQVSNETSLSKEDYLTTLDQENFAALHPNFVIQTNPNSDDEVQFFYNPGEVEVRNFIKNSILEIVTHYDIDAITLENYYYPTQGFNNTLDNSLFNESKEEGITKDNWRRENITSLIQTIKNGIMDYNNDEDKRVQFGAMVSGIWDNYSEGNKLGSNTSGYSSYEKQYTDTREWVKGNSIDFIIPQVKWEFDHASSGYADVIDWWSNTVSGTKVNLYIGQYLNQYNSNLNWENAQEIPNQLRYNQSKGNIDGTLLFNYQNLVSDKTKTLINAILTIKNSYWDERTLPPSATNVDNKAPKAITHLFCKLINNSIRLQWKSQKDAKEYIIYRFKGNEEVNLNDPSKIFTILKATNESTVTYFDNDVSEKTVYKYFITVLDYANNEGAPVQFGLNTSENKYFTDEVVIFSVLSVITLGLLAYSALKVLKK